MRAIVLVISIICFVISAFGLKGGVLPHVDLVALGLAFLAASYLIA